MAGVVQTRTQLQNRIPGAAYVPESAAFLRNEIHPQVLNDLLASMRLISDTGSYTVTGSPVYAGGLTNATFAEATNGASLAVKNVSVLKSALSGATVTAASLIPAGAIVLAVVVRVTTLITGATSFKVGDGVTANLWGNAVAVAAGTVSTGADFLSTFTPIVYPAANDVVLTAAGSNFTAGAVRITVFFMAASGPTS